jgi:hypothetical protein
MLDEINLCFEKLERMEKVLLAKANKKAELKKLEGEGEGEGEKKE